MKTTMTKYLFSAALLLGLLGFTLHAAAADRMQELQDRFKSRLPEIRKLKAAGAIGETATGTVEFVKGSGDAEATRLVREENTDRAALYQLIAQQEGTTANVVAERNAARNFERAKPGEYLKGKDGRWQQKR